MPLVDLRTASTVGALLVLLVTGRGCSSGDLPTPPPGTPADSLPRDSTPVDTPPAGGTGGPPGAPAVRLAPVASGLDFPLDLTAPPGDPRLFVVEKSGRIRIVRDGAVLPRPFLDLSGAVASGAEQGLLGLAFHPQYATNGRFFIDFTDRAGDTRVVAYRVSSDPDVADAATADTLLAIAQPYANHNGGHLVFGPDGKLYVGMGDGGSAGDPQGHAQRLDDLLGSLLRLDVDGPTGYAVPPDNPFVGRAGARGELWDLGLRNPWRFSFDRATGDLYIADVGQGAREEVNVAPAAPGGAGRGLNYGWNIMEGTICYQAASCNRTGLTLPVLDYGHDQGCSITGGGVYRGAAIPALQGTYFYSDFCSGWIRSFRWVNGAVTDPREWPTLKPGGQVPSFGEDAAGELYVLDAGGTVYRVVPQ
ncbi:MAG TPA: PQQ-dependent sugar dehydrogenase [Gemmatimonadales bacterium]|nr:PQQ-dependent sugar dehydrogenase [Gemmatimonadales bacterium]